MRRAIILHRSGGFGDTLLATTVARRLRRENPDHYIIASTEHPNAFYLSPHVDLILTHPGGAMYPTIDTRLVNLDFASEQRPDLHPVDAYFEVAFGDTGNAFDKTVVCAMEDLPAGFENDWDRTVTVHPNISWANRTLSPEWWGELTGALRQNGYRVLALGTRFDHDLSSYGAIDTRDRFTTPQQAMAIHQSACFVCFASGLLGLAGGTDAPIVSLHTISLPQFSSMYRHGELGWNSVALTTPLDCRGCHDRREQGSTITHMDCPLGHGDCVRSFDVGEVVRMAELAIRNDRRKTS